ncbi:MAG: hypothetical protein ACI81W_000426 [Saprospiraceae bacterium]|jgi:hypothetical protein
MDNQDFDKIFSGGLGEEQEFDFRESDWEEVAEAIASKSKDRLLWWRWLIPIMFIVFGSVIYCLVSDLKVTKREVLVLNEKLSARQIEKTDTLYNKITIITYDTIHQIVTKEKGRTKNNYSVNQPIEFYNNESSFNDKSNTKRADTNENINYKNVAELIPVISLSEIPLKEVEIQIDKEEEHFYLTETQFPEKKRGIKDKFKIGLTNGWAVTENYSAIDSTSSVNGLGKKVMLDFGLRGEWAFNKHLSTIATVSIEHVRFNSFDKVVDKLAVYEAVLPDASGGLIKARTSQTNLNYKLGVKYLFGAHKKWTPYAGVNIEAQSRLIQKAEASYFYAYQEINTKSAEYRNPDFKITALTLFAGYEYQFSGRFSWQVEAWHRFNFNKEIDQIYARFGIRNTVLYHF